MAKCQYSLITLFALTTAAAFVAWGWQYIVPPAVAIVKGGDWKILVGVVCVVVAASFWLVRNFR